MQSFYLKTASLYLSMLMNAGMKESLEKSSKNSLLFKEWFTIIIECSNIQKGLYEKV